ncbi:MAG TPA: DUF996 domain-containing protein [Nitrososphaerales archaeon]|nr:DUF996 domain-containing protein [Nitrososphaerales archaeon]
MGSISQAKTLGGIGAILILLSFVPYAGGVFGIVGFVMVLVAVKYIADDVRDGGIFNNMVIAVVLSIVGILVGSLVALPTVISAFTSGYFTGPNFTPSPSITTAQWIAFGTAIGVGLFVAWAFFIASAVFMRRSYRTIGSKVNVGMFGTAGLLYLIGAATTIIGIGFALLLVAEILTAVAFFSLPEQVQRVPQAGEAQTLPPSR